MTNGINKHRSVLIFNNFPGNTITDSLRKQCKQINSKSWLYNIQILMRRNFKLGLVLCLIAMATCQDYNNQGKWQGECQTGQKQSPINIKSSLVIKCVNGFSFDLSSRNELYTQIAYNHKNENLKTPFDLSTITITNNNTKKEFNSLQFHFHHLSEHQIDGKSFALELHVVHQASDKSLAVYGVLFQVVDGIFADPFDSWNLDTKIDVKQKFPIQLSTPARVYHYKGSLTTPDCAEGVNWFVNTDPIPIKGSSLAKIAKLINEGHNNNRQIQATNNRTIEQSGNTCSSVKHFGVTKPHHLLRHQ